MDKVVARGAEALLTRKKDILVKDRIKKAYRIPEIDEELRQARTRREAKILIKLKDIAPALISTDNQTKLEIEYIQGDVVKNILDKNIKLAEQIGQKTAYMHDKNIIHGDLTTSNMMLQGKEIKFIDFGLSFVSEKIEDKAVDLHLFREAVESKHFRHEQEIWKHFLKGYTPKNGKEILKRLEQVETRGRNKQKY